MKIKIYFFDVHQIIYQIVNALVVGIGVSDSLMHLNLQKCSFLLTMGLLHIMRWIKACIPIAENETIQNSKGFPSKHWNKIPMKYFHYQINFVNLIGLFNSSGQIHHKEEKFKIKKYWLRQKVSSNFLFILLVHAIVFFINIKNKCEIALKQFTTNNIYLSLYTLLSPSDSFHSKWLCLIITSSSATDCSGLVK